MRNETSVINRNFIIQCKYFGPKLDEERVKSFVEKENCQSIVNELSCGANLYNGLYGVPPNDVMLLISPMCLDVGWILNILRETCGYVLVNVVRLNVSVSIGRQFGIPEKTVDYFESGNGVSHLLIIRNENPLHALRYALDQCLGFMADHGMILSSFCGLLFIYDFVKKLQNWTTINVSTPRHIQRLLWTFLMFNDPFRYEHMVMNYVYYFHWE